KTKIAFVERRMSVNGITARCWQVSAAMTQPIKSVMTDDPENEKDAISAIAETETAPSPTINHRSRASSDNFLKSFAYCIRPKSGRHPQLGRNGGRSREKTDVVLQTLYTSDVP